MKTINENEIVKLILDTRKGNLKINSSRIGNKKIILKELYEVNSNCLNGGNKLKYFNGTMRTIPKIMSIIKRSKNDFHTRIKKEEGEFSSYSEPSFGFLKNKAKSLKSIFLNENRFI